MNDNSVREQILDAMEEADIITREGRTASCVFAGREYLLLLTVVDITDWNTTDGE